MFVAHEAIVLSPINVSGRQHAIQGTNTASITSGSKEEAILMQRALILSADNLSPQTIHIRSFRWLFKDTMLCNTPIAAIIES